MVVDPFLHAGLNPKVVASLTGWLPGVGPTPVAGYREVQVTDNVKLCSTSSLPSTTRR